MSSISSLGDIRRPKSAFTLVELLVVITIIGILIALLLPAVQAAREAARSSQCMNNSKQIGLAVHNFHMQFGALPPAWCNQAGNRQYGSLFYAILPFVEQNSIFELSHNQNPAYGLSIGVLSWVDMGPTTVKRACSFVIPGYLCPSENSGPNEGLWPTGAVPGGKTEIGNWAFSNYGVNYQVFGNPDAGDPPPPPLSNFEGNNLTLAQITDGTSNTIGFAEKYRRCGGYGSLWGHGSWTVNWMSLFAYGSRGKNEPPVGYTTNSNPPGAVGPSSKPVSNPNPWEVNCDPMRTTSAHPNGLNITVMDGSVRSVSFSIDSNVWWSLCTISGGETQTMP